MTVSSSTRHHAANQAVAVQLKAATTSLHRQLDSHPLVRSLAKGELSKERHHKLLCAFHLAYADIEPSLLAFEKANNVKFPYAPRLPCLREITGQQVDTVASVAAHKTRSAAAYWGTRYVLDGSCHGAQILLPRIQTQFGTGHPSLNYWKLLASQSRYWPALVEQLNDYHDAGQVHATCLHAAQTTFQSFIAALSGEA